MMLIVNYVLFIHATPPHTFNAVFRMLLFLADLDFFRWLNPILASIERVNAARRL